MKTHWEVLFTIAREGRGFRALGGFHGHEQFLFARTSCVERGEARCFNALDACARADITNGASL